MAFTLIGHSTGNSSISGGTASTNNIDTTGANLILLATSNYSSEASSTPVDSKGNTYTQIASVNWTANNILVRLWVCIAPTVGSGHVFSHSASYNVIQAQAWNTGLIGATLDRVTIASGPTAGTLVPRQNNELLVTAYGNADSTFGLTCSGGFTVTDSRQSVGGDGQSFAYLLQTTSASSTPTWSGSGQGSTIQASYVASNNTNPTLTLDPPPTYSVRPKPTTPVLQVTHPLARNLIGAWVFSEGSGNTLTDLSGALPRADGSFTGGSANWTGSSYGSSILFNGGGQYVNLGSPSKLNLTNTSFSVASLIYPTSFGPANSQLYSRDSNAAGGRNFYYSITASTWVVECVVFQNDTTWTILDSNTQIPLFKTSLVVCTFQNGPSSGTLNIYINGILDNTTTTVSPIQSSPTAQTRIGARQYAGYEEWFAGNILGTFVWNRVLTPTEVAALSYDPFAMFRRPSRRWEWETYVAPTRANLGDLARENLVRDSASSPLKIGALVREVLNAPSGIQIAGMARETLETTNHVEYGLLARESLVTEAGVRYAMLAREALIQGGPLRFGSVARETLITDTVLVVPPAVGKQYAVSLMTG